MAVVQRLRLIFSKGGAARHISHLDLARALERSLNRASLPIAYTQGFNRRPRLSMAAALPLGYTSDAEVADVWLTERIIPEDIRTDLMKKMAPGISVKSVVEVPLTAPSLQQQMVESIYEVQFLDPVDEITLQSDVAAMLAAKTIVRERFRLKSNQSQSFDLRPLILNMWVAREDTAFPRLVLHLVQTASQTGRPDDVLASLGYDPLNTRVHRVELRFSDFDRSSV